MLNLTFPPPPQHLTTFVMDRKDAMITIDDGIRKLRLLDAKGKVWTQDMLLQVEEKSVSLIDQETKVGGWEDGPGLSGGRTFSEDLVGPSEGLCFYVSDQSQARPGDIPIEMVTVQKESLTCPHKDSFAQKTTQFSYKTCFSYFNLCQAFVFYIFHLISQKLKPAGFKMAFFKKLTLYLPPKCECDLAQT